MANNKEMKTLGGYEIVDEKAREDINIVAEKADEAYSLAKGATRAFVYNTYEDMISELNVLDKAELLVNFHVMIREVCVPDLWISGVSDEHVEYTYTSNEDFIVDLTEDGVVQVGHFVLSALETQKVDLSEYVKNTDYASKEVAGVVKIDGGVGMKITNDGCIYVRGANEDEIDKKSNKFITITPNNLDYAVKKALSDCQLTGGNVWTDEEKAKALELLGGVAKALLSVGAMKDTVALRDGDGRIYTVAPKFDSHAATKKYVDDGFVGKVTTETDIQQAYVKGTDGSQKMMNITNMSQANTIVERDGSGNFYVTIPELPNHCATKKYVDDLVGSVETILTELHTYAQTKIGGEA